MPKENSCDKSAYPPRLLIFLQQRASSDLTLKSPKLRIDGLDRELELQVLGEEFDSQSFVLYFVTAMLQLSAQVPQLTRQEPAPTSKYKLVQYVD